MIKCRYRLMIDVPEDSTLVGVLTENDKVIIVCERETTPQIGFNNANQ